MHEGQIQIIEELRALLPPQGASERAALERDLLSSGRARDPLKWALIDGDPILLDGHNRLEIARRHPASIDLKFEKVFEVTTMEEAKDWILRFAFARRNMTPEQQRLVVGRRYAEMEGKVRNRKVALSTATGVPERTIIRWANFFSDATEAAGKLDNEAAAVFWRRLEDGRLRPNQQQIRTMARLPQPTMRRVWNLIESQPKKTLAGILRWADRSPESFQEVDLLLNRKEKRYRVLLADPPWGYDSPGLGDPEERYKTMPIEDLMNVPVGEIAEESAVLFMWTPGAKMDPALSLGVKWGFSLVSVFPWFKSRGIPGPYGRITCEFLLVMERGAKIRPVVPIVPSGRIETDDDHRWKHSAKPQSVIRNLTEGYPGLKKIELWGRGPAWPGWESYGNEAIVERAVQNLLPALEAI